MKYNDNCNVNTAMPIVQQEYSSTHWKTSLGLLGTDRCAKRRGRSEGVGEWLAITGVAWNRQVCKEEGKE